VKSYQNEDSLLVSLLAHLLLVFLRAGQGLVYGSHGEFVWLLLDGVDAPLQKSSRIDTAQSFSAIYARAALILKKLELFAAWSRLPSPSW
jgi:hypothetical protein